MAVIEVGNFVEFHQALTRYQGDRGWIFRGHSKDDWRLMPKAGRSPAYRQYERDYFESWKRRAVEYLTPPPPNDWEWLAVAQHHGLATRFLDWSTSPIIACFFAVTGQHAGHDAAVWAFRPERVCDPGDGSPFDVKGVGRYWPSAFSPRISRQWAAFTVHGPPDTEVTEDAADGPLDRIVFRADCLNQLRIDLDTFGYNHATIFPGLDGLSDYYNWLATSDELRGTLFAEKGGRLPGV